MPQSRIKQQPRPKLRELQRLTAAAVMLPLGPGDRTRARFTDGRPMKQVAASFIKPNDRLAPIERLEIYNKQYWFRVIDCLYDDYPGLRAVLGQAKFHRLCRAYLERCPSRSFSLRNLGSRLEQFIRDEPRWTCPRTGMALDMARFEWAQVVAFDGPAERPLGVDDLLGGDPSKLRVSLQPYMTLLELDFPLDDFVIAIKRRDSAMRSEASNAIDRVKLASGRRRQTRPRVPRAQRVCLAVHRFENALYYKRLDPPAFAMLAALSEGRTIERACERGVEVDPSLDAGRVQEWFRNWAELGWLCARRKNRQVKR